MPVRIAVLAYPRISNFDDFRSVEAGAERPDLTFIKPGQPIPGNVDIVILPGSKATIADMQALKDCGWDIDLRAHVRRGGQVLGVCGGYQMLGKRISDPDGIGGRSAIGIRPRVVGCGNDPWRRQGARRISGSSVDGAIPFKGYEMHIGRTKAQHAPMRCYGFEDGTPHGASDATGAVSGC